MSEILGRDATQSGPTALRILVGRQLRQLREGSGITREAAAYLIRGSHSKISRMEAGRTGFKLRDVADLLTLYGVNDEAERQAVLALAEQANAPAWWRDHRDVIPDWFEPYLGLERDAALIRTYEVQYVPGLLQTEDYARAVIVEGHKGDTPERIERRVAVRMRRQHILNQPNPRKLWVVLDEAALHRRVGGDAIMRAQLEHLAQMADLPHITVQVLPFTSAAAVGGVGPVTILRFAQKELPDVVYVEHLTNALYLTKSADVMPYQKLMDELGISAPQGPASRAILRQLIDTL
ncbi:helix-turn-helix domain-containing protein [Nonomuraea basaltis]|uniref:helix-turn-helix domain-containing protein n=1 Tax=Nonomuraea basaltis TaxID=2495887 RepID=UPI001486BAC4|nr:helix-turn-helix transcriptional regulator [Nonomuraea basaltis]